MAKEIERKYLVTDTSYRAMARGRRHIVQGYLSRSAEATVRVRIADEQAFLTIKGITRGCVRDEWEYAVPLDDARAMLECCPGRVINKVRYIVDYEGLTWEVDEFGGDLAPLVVAEVELPAADAEVALPSFVGLEVTGDARYYNSNM